MVGISRAFWISRILPAAFRTVKKRYLVNPQSNGRERNFNDAPTAYQTQPEDLAAIVFTSGSTGSPKGVRYLHQTFDAQINALKTVFAMQPGETDLTTLPIFGLFNPALGITSVLPEIDPRRPALADPVHLVHALVRHNITTAFASPIIGRKVASECYKRGITLPIVNRFFLAGAPVPPDLVEQLGSVLTNGKVLVPYGATEALPVSWTDGSQIQKYKHSILDGDGSLIGKPLPNADVRILPNVRPPLANNSHDYQTLKEEEVGEICVSGKNG